MKIRFTRFFEWLVTKKITPGSAGSRGRLVPESYCVATVDDVGVRHQRPKGKKESVTWDQLQAVIIETNDRGPMVCDVYWILLGRNKTGCVIPQGATGEKDLLERLQRLPKFDNEQLIAAMGCTGNRTFLCWKKPDDDTPLGAD